MYTHTNDHFPTLDPSLLEISADAKHVIKDNCIHIIIHQLSELFNNIILINNEYILIEKSE